MHCAVDNRPNKTTPNEDKKIMSKKSLDFAKFTAFEIFKHIISANEDATLESIQFLVKDT